MNDAPLGTPSIPQLPSQREDPVAVPAHHRQAGHRQGLAAERSGAPLRLPSPMLPCFLFTKAKNSCLSQNMLHNNTCKRKNITHKIDKKKHLNESDFQVSKKAIRRRNPHMASWSQHASIGKQASRLAI